MGKIAQQRRENGRKKLGRVTTTASKAKKEGAALHESNFVDESNFVNDGNFVNESNFTLGNKEHLGKAFAVSPVQVDDDATDFCLPRSHRADSGFFSRPTHANKPVVWQKK